MSVPEGTRVWSKLLTAVHVGELASGIGWELPRMFHEGLLAAVHLQPPHRSRGSQRRRAACARPGPPAHWFRFGFSGLAEARGRAKEKKCARTAQLEAIRVYILDCRMPEWNFGLIPPDPGATWCSSPTSTYFRPHFSWDWRRPRPWALSTCWPSAAA